MASLMEIMQLCRLCLVKDQVNIPIFEEQGDIRQIFLKISACLPVKVSREDNLPKNICDGCSYKLEILYQFWNTSANSEKQLLKWLSQIGVEKNSTEKVAVAPAQPHSSLNSDGVVLKQEIVDLADTHSVEELAPDDLDDSNDAQDYILQQQQLPYQPFQFQQDGFTDGEATASASTASATITSETVEAAPKRKRRAAAMKALPPHIDSEEEDEDDVDMVETKIAKTEEQSDDSGAEDPEPTAFVGLPSTSTDNEQPGPSGVGKGSTEAPLPGVNAIQFVKLLVTESIFLKPKEGVNRNVFLSESIPRLVLSKYQCRYCDETLPTEAVLTEHVNKCHAFVCFHCKKVFKSVTAYKFHWHVPDPNCIRKELKCSQCDLIFYHPHNLKEHESDHKKDQYICDICGKSISSSRGLVMHKNVHEGKKLFSCSICKKSVGTRNALNVHEATHRNARPYWCRHCGKTFTQRTPFNIHLRSHTGEKPYCCDICKKRFVTKTLLKSHSKTHGESLA